MKALLWLLGSFFLFIGGFLLVLKTEIVVLLVIALILHELGHLAAMKIFGYTNIKFVFIPFLGAAVSGTTEESCIWKNVVLSLAGPIPGIVLGSFLYLTNLVEEYEIVRNFAYVLVVLNLFNLLPIEPLDGGKVLHQLLYIRWKWLEVLSVFGSIWIFLSFLTADFFYWPNIIPLILLGFFFCGIVIGRWELHRANSILKNYDLPNDEKHLNPHQWILVMQVMDKLWFWKPDNWESKTALEYTNVVLNRVALYRSTNSRTIVALLFIYIGGLLTIPVCSNYSDIMKEDVGEYYLSQNRITKFIRFAKHEEAASE